MADTGHTAGQFGGHTPGPLTVRKCSCGHPMCKSYSLAHADSQGGYSLEDATLYAAAPSLLARAEAAEERVRVLEAALARLGGTLSAYPEFRKCIPANVLEMIDAEYRAVQSRTTGVQHG